MVKEFHKEFIRVATKTKTLLSKRAKLQASYPDNLPYLQQYPVRPYLALIERWNAETKKKKKPKEPEPETEDASEFSFDNTESPPNATKCASGLKPEHPLEVKVTQLIADHPQIANDMADVIETLKEAAELQKKASDEFLRVLQKLPLESSPLSESHYRTYVVLKL